MIECEDLVSVTIINTQGSVIKEAKESENNQTQMTVDDLPVGVYYLKINTKHGETIQKVLKTK